MVVIFSPMPYWQIIWHKICSRLPFWQKAGAACHFGSLSAILAFGTGFATAFSAYPFLGAVFGKVDSSVLQPNQRSILHGSGGKIIVGRSLVVGSNGSTILSVIEHVPNMENTGERAGEIVDMR